VNGNAVMVIGLIGLSIPNDRGTFLPRMAGLMPPGDCTTGMTPGDTVRLTGIMVPSGRAFASDPPRPPGSLKLWKDRDGRLHYAEWWVYDTLTFLWDGDVGVSTSGLPRSFVARRARNGVVTEERVEADEDTVVVVRNGRHTTEQLGSDVVRMPAVRPAPLFALIMQCAAGRPNKEFRTKEFGVVRAREITTTTLAAGGRKQSATLYVLDSDSLPQLATAWLQSDSHRLIAMRFAEGVMDLVSTGWEGSVDQLVQAEARAALAGNGPETCAGGSGIGSCAPEPYFDERCKEKVKTLTLQPGRFAGTATLSDSGYSVTSDGLGPYRHGTSNVHVMCCGVGGFLRLDGTPRGAPRWISVDLNHPVAGDIGVPIGTIKVDGAWPGKFIAPGAAYFNELSFLYMNVDTTKFTSDIPVGATVRGGVGFDFFVNGVHHVLQMNSADPINGPCAADDGPVFGAQGTTAATISRPNATTWIIDLPPGSVGRLVDNHRGDKNAVSKGLYYVSLHLVIQQ